MLSDARPQTEEGQETNTKQKKKKPENLELRVSFTNYRKSKTFKKKIPERRWRKECFLYRELYPTFQRNCTRKMVG